MKFRFEEKHNLVEQVELREACNDADDSKLTNMTKAAAVLRVFNYYRVFFTFVLMLLFFQFPEQTFVGKHEPDIFSNTILYYLALNVFVSFLCLGLSDRTVSRRDFVSLILTLDVIFLNLLMFASGGVSSGLGNFLIFPVAFAGVLVYGRYSVVIAAISIILGFYSESNIVMQMGDLKSEQFFNVGVLGVALFAVNILFQYFAVQLRRREAEVTTLQRLNEMRDLAERTKSQLDDSNAIFEVLLNSAGDGVLGLDIEGNITFANPKAAELLCVSARKLAGRSIQEFSFPEHAQDIETTKFQHSGLLHRLDLASRSSTSMNEWQRGNGQGFVVDYSCEAIVNSRSEPMGAVVIFQDATKRREMEAEMNRLANFDSLTNLANRGHFQIALEQAVARYRRSNSSLAVLLLDLDHFKYINDHFGHDYGDELLLQVASRINACIRNSDTSARLGGDEFAVLLIDFNSENNVALVARNLIEEVSKPYDIKGKQIRVSTSIGVSLLDRPETSTNALLKSADIALYAAKSDGRNTFRFFNPDMEKEAETTQKIQIALQEAIEHNEFHMNFQPIVSLSDFSIHHSESLVRWNPRDEDPISPDIFIPIAEETGKICEIGHWVLNHVFEQLATWRTHYPECPKVSVNVSPRQLSSSQFREQIETALDRYRIPPEAIELELTETAIMSDPEVVLQELLSLRELGVSISLDDFGTGNSSLEYLRKLPIDQLKIDKSFVQGIGGEEHDEAIILVIIAMAKALDLTVVAEGIETEEQLKFLVEAGCHFGQGYFFYRPADAIGLVRIMDEEALGKISLRSNRTEAKVMEFPRTETLKVINL